VSSILHQNPVRMKKSGKVRSVRQTHKENTRNAFTIVVGKRVAKRPLGGLRCSREDNVKIYLNENDLRV